MLFLLNIVWLRHINHRDDKAWAYMGSEKWWLCHLLRRNVYSMLFLLSIVWLRHINHGGFAMAWVTRA
jgi:hypothetical protein